MWAIGAEGEKLPGLVKKFEAAGTTPDAAMVGSTWMGEFAGQGALAPTPKSIDTKAFIPCGHGLGVG